MDFDDGAALKHLLQDRPNLMSLLTRCPACTTIYKVVPDQLRISQGWVKCGQCGDIFDATQHLVHIEPEEFPVESTVPEPIGDETTTGQEPVTVGDIQTHSEASESLQPIADGVSVTESASEDAHDPNAVHEPEFSAQDPKPFSDDVPREPETAQPNQQESVAGAQELSFMRGDRRAQFWRKPWVRLGLVLLALALILSLVGQWVYRERHFLAAFKPEWKQPLQAFCDVLGCRVEALRQIEALSIDAAAFNKIDDSHYRLSFTLKNSAALAMATPSIELTLTDLQDQVVLRRVFSAEELDDTTDLVSALSPWQVAVALRLEPLTAVQRVVGYRVLAFYP